MTENLHFYNPEAIDKKKALEIFSTGSTEEICEALVAVALDESQHWQWVQEVCLKFLDHPEVAIRRLAATCLGHVARIHGKLDREEVVKALRSRLQDKAMAGSVEDALEDIHQFISVFKGYESLSMHHTAALSTFGEFLEGFQGTLDSDTLKLIEDAEKRFPFTTTLKCDCDLMEEKMLWCQEVFGPMGELSGRWTSQWLGKTGYDFGYQKFFFKTQAMRDVFEREVRI